MLVAFSGHDSIYPSRIEFSVIDWGFGINMYQLNRSFVAKVLNFLLAISLITALLGVIYDLNSTLKLGGNDLRNRVVGARLMIQDADPYYFRWQQGDPETLLDPLDKPQLPVSRVTIPPTGLALYIPFANLPYIYQRFIWFFLQWGALLLSLFLLLKRNRNSWNSKDSSSHTDSLINRFLLAYGLFFIGSSAFWRLHLQVGQIYVFYALLTASSYWISSKQFRFKDEISGLLIGLAAAIRFPVLVMILPMLIFRKFRLLIATLIGFVFCIGTTLIIFGQQVWVSYFSAMKTISQLSHGLIKVPNTVQKSAISQIVEGMFFGIPASKSNQLPAENLSITLFLDNLFDIHISTGYLIAGLMLFLLFYSLLLQRSYKQTEQRFRPAVIDAVFISGGLMLIVADLLLPAPRYTYNDIQLLVPLILLLKNIDFYDIQTIYHFLILCLGLLMANGLFVWLPYESLLGQLLIIPALLLMSLKMKQRESKSTEVVKYPVSAQR